MRKKFIFLFLAILLLSPWPAYSYSDKTPRQDSVGAEISEHSALPTWNENASSAESVVSDGQAIVIKNPTFQELKDFILKDPTSRSEFILNQYECRHFATDVDNNAEAAGLRCAFVLLCFDQGQHAVVAFYTTDNGLVYIEPQTDARIHPQVGGKYQEREIKEILIAW